MEKAKIMKVIKLTKLTKQKVLEKRKEKQENERVCFFRRGKYIFGKI